MASRLATTVRVASRKLPQTRKAINIVSCITILPSINVLVECLVFLYRLQTPSAVSKLKVLLKNQEGVVSIGCARPFVY